MLNGALGILNFYVKVKMEENGTRFRFLMLFYFNRGNKRCTKKRKEIHAVHGDGAIAESAVHKYLSMLKRGNFNLRTAG